MIRKMMKRARRVLIVAVPALALGATAAQADFRGGGVVFGFTDECQTAGYVQNSYATMIRYTASELQGRPPSQMTLAFFTGTEHFSLWGGMGASTAFLGGAGRRTFTRFAFYGNRPLMRIVQRNITRRVNENGPNTVQNAREVQMRLRIQNFANVRGCAATVVATLRRD